MNSETFNFNPREMCYFNKTSTFILNFIIFLIYIGAVVIIFCKLKMKSTNRGSKSIAIFMVGVSI